jgi:CheY-like chemotaxis protein
MTFLASIIMSVLLFEGHAMKTILTVDDSPDMRALNEMVLALEGYKVISASSGKEALDLILSNQKIDLVLLDLHMPIMGGLEFLKQLEALKPGMAEKLPIVLLTGDEMPLPPGARGQIRKMSDIRFLVAQVESYIGRA